MKIKKTPAKHAIADRRAKEPEIFVRVENRAYWKPQYAQAKIRVKRGEYQYLTWRDGNTIRTFYLGRKKNRALPIGILEQPRPRRPARPAGARA